MKNVIILKELQLIRNNFLKKYNTKTKNMYLNGYETIVRKNTRQKIKNMYLNRYKTIYYQKNILYDKI